MPRDAVKMGLAAALWPFFEHGDNVPASAHPCPEMQEGRPLQGRPITLE